MEKAVVNEKVVSKVRNLYRYVENVIQAIYNADVKNEMG